jgi:hypothetical protein
MGLIRVTIRGLLSQLDGFAGLLSALTGHWPCHPMLRRSFHKADIHAQRSISSPSMSQKRDFAAV